ncbi:MAG: DUF5618 family protein [Runella sp.]
MKYSKITHIKEAKRYLLNAKNILSKNGGKSGRFYSDRKYVRMAGNTAWNGVLEVLDGTFEIRKNLKSGQRPDIKDYQSLIAQKNQSKLRVFNAAYDTLHKAMGYDGNLSVEVVQAGLKQAEDIIDWCENISANSQK